MRNPRRYLMPLLIVLLLAAQMMNPVTAHADDGTPPTTAKSMEGEVSTPPEEADEAEDEASEGEEASVAEENLDEEEAPVEETTTRNEPVKTNETEDEVPSEGEVPEGIETAAEDEKSTEEPAETNEAEDHVPTEGEVPEGEEIATEDGNPSEEPLAEEITSVDEAETPQEDLTVAEVLEQAPEGTEIVVLNEEGGVEPLATQEAAEIVITGDPIWCPDTVAPQAGIGGCTDPGVNNANYDPTSLASLLTYLDANEPSTAGMIWVEDSYHSSVNDAAVSSFIIDGTSFTTMKDFAFTIQGGWNGISGSKSITGTSTFDGDRMVIKNWKNDVTINNILIKDVDNKKDLVALRVETTGNINLDYVEIKNNDDRGARLVNAGGSGNVTVNNSKFNQNGDTGLLAVSNGDITLNQVLADGNGWRGVALDNAFGSGKVAITSSTFTDNDAIGLHVLSTGEISASDLTASDNDRTGAYLDNCGFIGFACFGSGTDSITLTGTNVFNGNKNDGLVAFSNSDITLNNVTANNNDCHGTYLYSDVGAITMAGINAFNGNYEDGLWADAYLDISVKNITANKNNGTSSSDGAELYSDSGAITLTGTNTFNNNKDDGLEVDAVTGATISNVTANKNGEVGVDIYVDSGDISLTNVTAKYNAESGTRLEASGDSTVTNGKFECNGFYGANGSATSGTFNLNTINFGGNNLGPYAGSPTLSNVNSYLLNCNAKNKKTVVYPSKPINQVSASAGATNLDCDQYKGTQLNLPNGDFAYFPCPIQDSASLTALEPANTSDEYSPQSGLTAGVTKDGNAQEKLSKYITVSFVIPDGADVSSLAILYWNGSAWVEFSNDLDLGGGKMVGLGGFVNAEGTHFQARVNFTGDFVLVSK